MDWQMGDTDMAMGADTISQAAPSTNSHIGATMAASAWGYFGSALSKVSNVVTPKIPDIGASSYNLDMPSYPTMPSASSQAIGKAASSSSVDGVAFFDIAGIVKTVGDHAPNHMHTMLIPLIVLALVGFFIVKKMHLIRRIVHLVLRVLAYNITFSHHLYCMLKRFSADPVVNSAQPPYAEVLKECGMPHRSQVELVKMVAPYSKPSQESILDEGALQPSTEGWWQKLRSRLPNGDGKVASAPSVATKQALTPPPVTNMISC